MRRKGMRKLLLIVFLACASQQPLVQKVQSFRQARDRGDLATAQSYIAPGARLFFESRSGQGEPYTLTGGSWDHWDSYFHSRNQFTGWRTEGRSVTATVHET